MLFLFQLDRCFERQNENVPNRALSLTMDNSTDVGIQEKRDPLSVMVESMDDNSKDQTLSEDTCAKNISIGAGQFKDDFGESLYDDSSQEAHTKNEKSSLNCQEPANNDKSDVAKYPERNEKLLKIVDCPESSPFLSSNQEELVDEIDALPANLRYSNFDLTYTLISVLTYLFDLVMDCAVAYYFYHLAAEHGIYHYWYFGLTVTFILIPSLTMNGFSLRYVLIISYLYCRFI